MGHHLEQVALVDYRRPVDHFTLATAVAVDDTRDHEVAFQHFVDLAHRVASHHFVGQAHRERVECHFLQVACAHFGSVLLMVSVDAQGIAEDDK